MQLEGGRISSSQLTILVIGYIIGSSVILGPGAEAKNSAWLAIIAGMLEALLFMWVYTGLVKRYPGKTAVEINDIIYGPYLGKLVSLFYLWFFLHLASLVARDFGEFFAFFMPQTPLPVFLMFTLLISAYAVKNGIEVIARCSLILVPILWLTLIMDVVLIAKDMKLSNLLPVMNITAPEFIKASHSVASFPFGESIAFIMVIAFLNKHQETRSSLVKAFLIAGLFYVIAAIRNTAILGAAADVATYPVFTAVRLINIANILTRLDIVIAVNLITMGFLYISVLYYGTVLGTAQMLKLRSYRFLILPIGAIILGLSLLNYDSYVTNIQFNKNIFAFYSMPFEFILPLITLMVAAIRKYPQESRGGTQ